MGGLSEVRGVRAGYASGGTRRAIAVALGVFVSSGAFAFASAQETQTEAEILESAPRTHTVQRGDTLWGLAGFYLSNPFGWPQIYEMNTSVVEDPHWIYPGEILALPLGDAVAVADQVRTQPMAGQNPDEDVWEVVERRPAGDRSAVGRGVTWFGGPSIFDTSPESRGILGGLDVEAYSSPALVSIHDFQRSPMLVERNTYQSFGRLARVLEGNPLGMKIPPTVRLRDVVTVELQDLIVRPGDRLRAIRWHAGTQGLEIAESVGMLDVLEADDETARAVVTDVYADFSVGDMVIPAETFGVPATLQQAIDDVGLEIELVALEVDQALLSEGDMVFINAGAEDGVSIGDEFVLFDNRDDAQARYEDRLATARVVRVLGETATVRITHLKDASPTKGAPGRRVRMAIGS